jgi:hypothetical protein
MYDALFFSLLFLPFLDLAASAEDRRAPVQRIGRPWYLSSGSGGQDLHTIGARFSHSAMLPSDHFMNSDMIFSIPKASSKPIVRSAFP